MADGTNTSKKADPVAPGSSKSKKLMSEFFHGALDGLTINYSQNQGQYVDSPIGNGLVTRQNVNKDVSKYTPGKAYGSSLLSRFSPFSSFKEIAVKRIGTTQIHSGDADVDKAVSDALNDVSDVVNVFQDNVRKAFKSTDKRLTNLETDVKRVDKRLRTVENDNKNITKKLKEMARPVISGRTINPKELRTTLPAANDNGGSSNTAAGSQSSLLGSALTTAVEGIIGARALKALRLLGPAALIGGVGAATYGMRRTDDDKNAMYDSDVKTYGRNKADILKDRRNSGITGWLNNRFDDVYQKFAGKKKDEKKGSPDQKANEFPSEDLELTTKGMMTLESDKDAVITSKTKITLKAPEIVIDGRLNIKQHIVSRGVVTEPASSGSDRTGAAEIEGRTNPTQKTDDPGLPQSSTNLGGNVTAPVTPVRPNLTNSSPTMAPQGSQQAPENFTLTKGYHPRGTSTLEASNPMGNAMGPMTGPSVSGSALKGDALRRGVYMAFRNQGYSHQGALVMSGEVARENGFNPNLVFGNHIDPANHAKNSGMFSWQGSRNPELMKFLAARGALDKNGNIMRDQNALNAQAAFVKYELSKKQYGGGKYNEMLSQPNVDRNAAADAIGRNYIKWAIDSPRYRAAGIRNRTHGYDATARAVAQMANQQVASLDLSSGVTQQDASPKKPLPKGAYNSLTAKANFMQPSQFGPPGSNIVSVKTAGGHKFRINAASKEAFQRTIEDLENAGMPLGSIGGYNPRPGGIAGTGRMSQHAMGNAMDIGSQTGRDIISKASREWIMKNPQKWREILDRNGMISGGDWRNPDLGHLEWSGRKPWLENPELYAERQQATKVADSRDKGAASDVDLKPSRQTPPIQELDDAPQRGVVTPNYSKNIDDRRTDDTSLKNPWWKFWAKENVTPKEDTGWANKIHKFDEFKAEKARKAIGLGGSDDEMSKVVADNKGKMTESDRLLQLNVIRREDGGWTPEQAEEAHGLVKNIYATPEDSLKDLKSTFQKAQDIQDARVSESIPKPPELEPVSGEEMTKRFLPDAKPDQTALVGRPSPHSQHGHEEPQSSLRAPRNDAEAQGPTPGSDGYGSMKEDPDGFCALCMT